MYKVLKTLLISSIIILISLCCYPQTNTAFTQQPENNKQLVITMNGLFNTNEPVKAAAYFSDSLVKMGNIGGKSFFMAMHDDILQTFPDVQTKIITLWTDEDWVIADCLFSGTHKGVASLPHHGGLLVGKQPTNKYFKVQHIRMYKIKNGKIVERKAVRDDIGMYQQLGILPMATSFKPLTPDTKK